MSYTDINIRCPIGIALHKRNNCAFRNVERSYGICSAIVMFCTTHDGGVVVWRGREVEVDASEFAERIGGEG